MKPILYLTTNPGKQAEIIRSLEEPYGIPVEFEKLDFDIPELQASTSPEVLTFSVEYAANRLNKPVLKSDTSLYIDYLGGLPGPYNAYFDKQIGVEKFLTMLNDADIRTARLEHCFGYCEPGEKATIFSGGSTGTISHNPQGTHGRWHEFFYIPDGETETLSQLKEKDQQKEQSFWGHAIDDFAAWYKEKYS